MFGTFTDSVKVTFRVPYKHSECNLNVRIDHSKCLVPLLIL